MIKVNKNYINAHVCFFQESVSLDNWVFIFGDRLLIKYDCHSCLSV